MFDFSLLLFSVHRFKVDEFGTGLWSRHLGRRGRRTGVQDHSQGHWSTRSTWDAEAVPPPPSPEKREGSILVSGENSPRRKNGGDLRVQWENLSKKKKNWKKKVSLRKILNVQFFYSYGNWVFETIKVSWFGGVFVLREGLIGQP